MKKTIIALSVMAAVAAQADSTTLYGSIRMEYKYETEADLGDTKVSKLGKSLKDDGSSTIGDSGSRFGIMGEDDLGNGMTAFYKYENRIKSAGLETNKLYLGVKGGFGSVSFGKQDLPTDILDDNSDPFNSLGANLQGGTAITEALEVPEPLGTSSDNSAVYMTPEMSGFQAGAAVVSNGAAGPDHVDGYDVAVKYSAEGFYAGLGYNYNNLPMADNGVETGTLALGYGNDDFNVGLAAEIYDFDGKDVNPTWVRIGGDYSLTEVDNVYASASMYDYDTKGLDDSYEVGLGYQHKMSARTRVWAEYTYTDLNNGTDDSNAVSLGLRTDF